MISWKLRLKISNKPEDLNRGFDCRSTIILCSLQKRYRILIYVSNDVLICWQTLSCHCHPQIDRLNFGVRYLSGFKGLINSIWKRSECWLSQGCWKLERNSSRNRNRNCIKASKEGRYFSKENVVDADRESKTRYYHHHIVKKGPTTRTRSHHLDKTRSCILRFFRPSASRLFCLLFSSNRFWVFCCMLPCTALLVPGPCWSRHTVSNPAYFSSSIETSNSRVWTLESNPPNLNQVIKKGCRCGVVLRAGD